MGWDRIRSVLTAVVLLVSLSLTPIASTEGGGSAEDDGSYLLWCENSTVAYEGETHHCEASVETNPPELAAYVSNWDYSTVVDAETEVRAELLDGQGTLLSWAECSHGPIPGYDCDWDYSAGSASDSTRVLTVDHEIHRCGVAAANALTPLIGCPWNVTYSYEKQ